MYQIRNINLFSNCSFICADDQDVMCLSLVSKVKRPSCLRLKMPTVYWTKISIARPVGLEGCTVQKQRVKKLSNPQLQTIGS